MNCQGNSRRIRILGIPKKGNRIFLEYHDNKITFIYRVLFASVVRGVEKMSIFPKKGLPAILNFASYIAARRGEVSELVEGARLEIVCTQKVPGVRISPSPPEILNPLETVGFLFLA